MEEKAQETGKKDGKIFKDIQRGKKSIFENMYH